MKNLTTSPTTWANRATFTRPSTRPLWAAVAVLGVCVLAMGATLVNVNHRAQTLAEASIPMSSATAAMAPGANGSTTAKATSDSSAPNKTASANGAGAAKKNTVSASAETAPAATQPNATQASSSASCRNCATVESVTPITREGQGSGVGVVAGGVLGGVVGNQVGNGNGRTAATVLGAIGGGWAGNKIEKNMKKTTVYKVQLRMQDGSMRTVEQGSAPLVGSKVTLDGNVIRPA